MSRTYRSNPSAKREYEVARQIIGYHHYDHDTIIVTRSVMKRLSQGGWKEAKRLLPKTEYAYQRTLKGDKLTHYFINQSVPHWYRHEIEKQHRFENKRELQRYLCNPDYEIMASDKPSGVEYYYWL